MEDNNKNIERYLNKLHQDILTIMDEVDRICAENNLRYYLMCGSCLGAVRHHGFIPWDDDLDIAMPRQDFNKLIDLTAGPNNILGNSFYLRWLTTEEYYNHTFAKICLKNTKFQESRGKSANNAGIFVDIFPLDECEAFNSKIERNNRLFRKLEQLIHYKGAEHPKSGMNVKNRFKLLITKIFPNTTIHRLMLSIIRPNKINCNDYQAIYGTPYPIKRMVFPQKWHGEGKRLLFEGRQYMCPAEPELYLEQVYGKDFMQIPPVEKRKSHYPLHVIFSDEEEMTFGKAQNRVSYTDVLS